jgi:hypothetical protein
VVGAGGFEPPNTGSKIPRLAASPRPRSSGPCAARNRRVTAPVPRPGSSDRTRHDARNPQAPLPATQRVPDSERRPVRGRDPEHGRTAASHQRRDTPGFHQRRLDLGEARPQARGRTLEPIRDGGRDRSGSASKGRHEGVDPPPVAIVLRLDPSYTSRLASGNPGSRARATGPRSPGRIGAPRHALAPAPGLARERRAPPFRAPGPRSSVGAEPPLSLPFSASNCSEDRLRPFEEHRALALKEQPARTHVFRVAFQMPGGGVPRRTARTGRPATSAWPVHSAGRTDLTPPGVCSDDGGRRPWASQRSCPGRDAARASRIGRHEHSR